MYICDECVVLCVEIIAPSQDERAELLERAGAQAADPEDELSRVSPELELGNRRIVDDTLTRTRAAASDAPETTPSVDVTAIAGVVRVTIRTTFPGLVIGRRGATVDDLRSQLEALIGGEVRVNVVPL